MFYECDLLARWSLARSFGDRWLAAVDDWLSDEIGHWRRNGIDVVVSLLTPHESSELGLNQEAAMSSQQGIQFLSLPIRDRAVPSSFGEMRTFVERTAALLLSEGKTVAVHCRQGIGRSAVFAVSLLVNAGVNLDALFQQIESAKRRGGARHARTAPMGRKVCRNGSIRPLTPLDQPSARICRAWRNCVSTAAAAVPPGVARLLHRMSEIP